MKRIIFLPFLLITISLFCQVNFESLSIDEALQKAKQTGKLIFIQYESPNCKQCSEVADKAFSDLTLGNRYNETFICIKINVNHPDYNKVNKLYNKNSNTIGSLYIVADGSLIHTYSKTTSLPKTYLDEADKALNKSGEGLRIKNLEDQYNKGNRSIGFLELYMNALKSVQLNTDLLLDEYLSLLPEDSLKSIQTFTFVISMTPLFESDAFVKLNSFYNAINNKSYNSDYPFHSSIKSKIGYKSLKKAVAEKDEKYAIRIASFVRSGYKNEPEKANETYYSFLLDYYDEINDTAKYLINAAQLYDNYYMNLSVDSVKKLDTINMKELVKKQTPVKEKRGDSIVMRTTISYKQNTQNFSNKLTDAAKKTLELTNDSVYLNKAISWSEKSLEFYQSYKALNTHALLLYKTGKKKEAIVWQEKAISLKRKQGLDTKTLEEELSNMM